MLSLKEKGERHNACFSRVNQHCQQQQQLPADHTWLQTQSLSSAAVSTDGGGEPAIGGCTSGLVSVVTRSYIVIEMASDSQCDSLGRILSEGIRTILGCTRDTAIKTSRCMLGLSSVTSIYIYIYVGSG